MVTQSVYLSPFLVIVLLIIICCSDAVPTNRFLAESAWPIAHHDPYGQGSTHLEGPRGSSSAAQHMFDARVAGVQSLVFTEDEKIMWGVSLTHIFKVDRSGDSLRLADAIPKPEEMTSNGTSQGRNSLLDNEGNYYVSGTHMIVKYSDKTKGISSSGIEESARTTIEKIDPSERILALTMTYDGFIVFCTNRGFVGILQRTLGDRPVSSLRLSTTDDIDVANGIAVDEFGGIYVVSSRMVHKLLWLPLARRLSFGWVVQYPELDLARVGHASKNSLGTAPSLMKVNGRLYVVAADGRRQQSVLVIDSNTGVTVATAPVAFSPWDPPTTDSYTDQSILIHENRFLVLQNALATNAPVLDELIGHMGVEDLMGTLKAPEFLEDNADLIPVLWGRTPRAVHQFEFNPLEMESLVTTWQKDDIGCPNSIPTVSASTRTLYCVGKENLMGEYPASAFLGSWTVEALDWDTGLGVSSTPIGAPSQGWMDVLPNSWHSAAQIGANREVVYGCIGGIIRVKEPVTEAPPSKSFLQHSNPQDSTKSIGSLIFDLFFKPKPVEGESVVETAVIPDSTSLVGTPGELVGTRASR